MLGRQQCCSHHRALSEKTTVNLIKAFVCLLQIRYSLQINKSTEQLTCKMKRLQLLKGTIIK